jgi:hypothetical protein
MLRRKRSSLTSGNCTSRDEKEPMGFSAKRWSGNAALEGEQLGEWQLYVEGRERCYGTFAWLRDGRSMLRRKRNSLTGGNCTLRDEKEPMVFWAKRWSGYAASGRRDGLRWKGNSLTSGNCTLRDGIEAMVRVLGEEMVWLCCVRRGTAGRVAIVR